MADRISIRLAAGSGPTFGVDDLACAAATRLECWHDEGLDVEWTPVHGGVAAAQAVLVRRATKAGPLTCFRMSSAQPSASATQASAQVAKVFETGTQLSFCWSIAIVVKSGSFAANAGAPAPGKRTAQTRPAWARKGFRIRPLATFFLPVV